MSAPPGGQGRPGRSGAYLAADGLHPVEPVQGLLGVPQVLLKLRVQDPHGKGDHGAWKQSQGGVSLSAAAKHSWEPAGIPKAGRTALHFLAKCTVMPVLRQVPALGEARVPDDDHRRLAATPAHSYAPNVWRLSQSEKNGRGHHLLQNRMLVDPL